MQLSYFTYNFVAEQKRKKVQLSLVCESYFLRTEKQKARFKVQCQNIFNFSSGKFEKG